MEDTDNKHQGRKEYRPLKQLRAFADALWLVSDETVKKSNRVHVSARTPQGYVVTIKNERDKDGYDTIVAVASKRGLEPAHLGVLERREKSSSKYTVRVILRPVTVTVEATNELQAAELVHKLLKEDSARNPIKNARLIVKGAS